MGAASRAYLALRYYLSNHSASWMASKLMAASHSWQIGGSQSPTIGRSVRPHVEQAGPVGRGERSRLASSPSDGLAGREDETAVAKRRSQFTA